MNHTCGFHVCISSNYIHICVNMFYGCWLEQKTPHKASPDQWGWFECPHLPSDYGQAFMTHWRKQFPCVKATPQLFTIQVQSLKFPSRKLSKVRAARLQQASSPETELLACSPNRGQYKAYLETHQKRKVNMGMTATQMNGWNWALSESTSESSGAWVLAVSLPPNGPNLHGSASVERLQWNFLIWSKSV